MGSLFRDMLLPAVEFYVWVSLSIFCTLASFAESGRCPLNGLRKPVQYNACSAIKYCCNDLPNAFPGYFSLDYGSGCQKKVPDTENVCCDSGLLTCPLTFHGCRPKEHSSRGAPDVNSSKSGARFKQSSQQVGNLSWSSDDHVFHSPDEEFLACLLNLREIGDHEKLPSVNSNDQKVVSSCSGHLLYYKGETSSRLHNIEIEKSPSSDSSSPCVSINPNKLDWGQNFIYHPSLVFLMLQNRCNDSLIEVYEPFSTDSQFYSFNYSTVVLGPGEVTSLSFVFLPKWLGLSSAELILQTSLGGFLVQANGVGIESPHMPGPLVGLGLSSGGWLSRNLSLTNPFDEAIHLEEVTALLSVTGSGGTLLAEAFCQKQNPLDLNEHIFSDAVKKLNGKGEQLDPVVMVVRPLSNWLISPRTRESILEVAFSPSSEGKVLGAICMQLLKPLKGQRHTIVIPFEAILNKTASCQDTVAPLSVYVEAVGSCDANETKVAVSVSNSASHLLKIVKISAVGESKKLLKVSYMGGLLLFPGSVTQMALVTYNSSDVDDTFDQMPDVNLSCTIQIEANDSSISVLTVPCQEIFGVCSRRQLESQPHLHGSADHSNDIYSIIRREEPSTVTKALHSSEVDDFVLQKWKCQSSISGLYVLDDDELRFPLVPVDNFFAKSIIVKNPSHQPVIVQLILNSEETVSNCKPQLGHLLPPWSSNPMHHDSSGPSRHGFSMMENAVTEAFLQPHGRVSLGPIWFHPSNRCEWKSSALIRNNLSGVEQLLLHGFGGSVSLILLEGSEHSHKLHFNMDMPSPLNMSTPTDIPYEEDASSGCRKPLLKKLSALNAGDFPVKVETIKVSGVECGLDGFLVHNCRDFEIAPGESQELGMSYQTDFSGHVIQRELEFKLAAGILVVPMQANLSIAMLTLCRKSFFWVRVKRCCSVIVLSALMFAFFWFILPQLMPSDSGDYFMKADKRTIPMVRPEGKMSTLHCNLGNVKSVKSAKLSRLESLQRDEAASILNFSKNQCGGFKQQMVTKNVNHQTETTTSPNPVKEGEFSLQSSKTVGLERNGKIEVVPPVSLTVRTRKDKKRRLRKRNGATSGLLALTEVSSSQSGNSTPTSPLSPITSPSSKETCSPSPGKSHRQDSSRSIVSDKIKDTRLNPFHPGNCSDKLFPNQQQSLCARNTTSKPMLLPSASFPGTGRSTSASPCHSPSRLAISPNARAPGPKNEPPKSVQAKERTNLDDRFTYNIWGNHFCGLNFMGKLDGPSAMTLNSIEGYSDSFFVRGPLPTFMSNSGLTSVSSSREEG